MNIYLLNENEKMYIALKKRGGGFLPEYEIFTDDDVPRRKFFNKSFLYNVNIFFLDDRSDLEKLKVKFLEIGTQFSLFDGQGKLLLDALAKLWDFMPNGGEYKGLVPFSKLKYGAKNEIVFYGGSFNPWHRGHLECLQNCHFEPIVVIPDYSPWKYKDEVDSCRYESFIRIYKYLRDTPYSLYPGFWAKDEANPTVDWVKDVRAKFISLLIGDDNFMSIFKWKDAYNLLEFLTKLYVVRRNFNRDDFDKVCEDIIRRNINIEVIFISDNAYDDLSSTKLRESRE